jgi:hypothetical protein
VEIRFVDDMLGGPFHLEDVTAWLDGTPVAKHVGGQSAQENLLATAVVSPVPHRLAVHARYRGSGYGVFAYLKGYVFELRTAPSLEVVAGRTLVVRCTAYERPDVVMEDRPQLRCNQALR